VAEFTTTPRSTNTLEVVAAVQKQLISQLSDIFPEDCIAVTDPDEWEDGTPENLINNIFMALCPGDSTFPEDTQIGGGLETVEELMTLEVYVFSAGRGDRTETYPATVYDPQEGLFELKRRVLRAMCQADPTGDNQDPLVSQLIPVFSATKPRRTPSGIWFIKLVFGIPHFLDLS
jgi:hypothetical protein